ncbi:MAG: metallophosphoesterase, partial [Nevskiales bacterium]
MSLRLAIVGDVHGCWDETDTEYFNRGDYNALLCTGDLPRLIGSLPTARRLASLRLPSFMIPGNHDATSAAQFLAELNHATRLAALLSVGQGRRESGLRRALGAVKLVGYSLDLLPWHGKPLGLLAARPYSMGGDRLYFRSYLQR